MSHLEDQLRATTDDIKSDADELRSLEEQKASLEPNDPRQDALAQRVVELAHDLVPKAAAQREIVAEA
ncbi:MAG: hypothetical protein ABIQ58_07010 [Candidatus Limnocylindrales bacterium]